MCQCYCCIYFSKQETRNANNCYETCSHLVIATGVIDEVIETEVKDGEKDHVHPTAGPHVETRITTAVEIIETGNENANTVDEKEAESGI